MSADATVPLLCYVPMTGQSWAMLLSPSGWFLPEASFGLRVLSLPASMCLCVNQLFVCTITQDPFKLGSPNVEHRCKTSNSKLTPFWTCPKHYSPTIQARISNFGPQMHFSTVKIPINLGLDWPWTSLSVWIPKLIFLHCGGVHWDCEAVAGLFHCCSGIVSQSLHQCTWRTHSQSGIGPLLL